MTRRLATVLVHLALVGAAVVTLLPLLWMVSASLMPSGEASAVPPRWIPSAPTLAHYRELFARLDLARAFLNSLAIATTVTAVSVTLNALAGYAFARFEFVGFPRFSDVVEDLRFSNGLHDEIFFGVAGYDDAYRVWVDLLG